jgi:hypothetical protein
MPTEPPLRAEFARPAGFSSGPRRTWKGQLQPEAGSLRRMVSLSAEGLLRGRRLGLRVAAWAEATVEQPDRASARARPQVASALLVATVVPQQEAAVLAATAPQQEVAAVLAAMVRRQEVAWVAKVARLLAAGVARHEAAALPPVGRVVPEPAAVVPAPPWPDLSACRRDRLPHRLHAAP